MAETVAPQEDQILYLEPDDEITSVVRRLREATALRVVLVAPGRTKATTSAIGLRLLAGEAGESGRSLALVADAATRALATEAGIAAFASVSEAQSGKPAVEEPPHRSRARIHVVRGERVTAPAISGPILPAAPRAGLGGATAPPPPGQARMDDTQPVPVVAAPRPTRAARPARTRSAVAGRNALIATIVLLVILAGLIAAVLPAATIHITPTVTDIGPVSYTVSLAGQADSGTLNSALSGTATGTYDDSKPARGVVVFTNYSNDRITVPQGARVAAGNQVYATDMEVLVPDSSFLFGPGTASVSVTAMKSGEGGNVAADAIDTVVDKALARRFKGSATRRIVDNPDPTSGGLTKKGPQISQKDVDSLVAKIKDDLKRQLAAHLAADPQRVYAPPAQPQDPQVTVPDGLVGTKDQANFDLQGILQYDRRYLTRAALTSAGAEQVSSDSGARPAGTAVVASSIAVEAGTLSATGDQVSAKLTVRAAVRRDVDLEQLKARISGMSEADATRILASVGTPQITFWPSWVDSVPRLGFRVEMVVDVPAGRTQ
ncbi:MAG: baseplate J/gp47 family protein [Chloroflexota bacterium]|nr:baseplate J/gp47 family protein [Chloroflexota bacterium]